MRFATRFDAWLVAVIAIGCGIGCVVPAIVFLQGAAPAHALWPALIAPAVLAVVFAATLPQYYEVREDGLFIRQGWRKFLFSYASLMELQKMTDACSAAVFSTHRILVVTGVGQQVLIAVKEEERFLAEVKRRAPQLEVTESGLKVPFAPSTVL